MKKWEKFSSEEIKRIVSESKSNREVAKKLGYEPHGGGTMANLRTMYKELDIDTSHFNGQGWNKNNYNFMAFTKGTPKKNGKTTLDPLITLRGRKCERCGLTEWLGKPINLEIHHIDGDRLNNSLDNLELLCPNCHSYTKNFCRSSGVVVVSDEDFVLALEHNSSIRQALIEIGLTPSGGNYTRAYELIHKNNITHLM